MKYKTDKLIFNILLFLDLSFIVTISSALLLSNAFRYYFTHDPILIGINGLFLILALGLSFMQNTIYPDKAHCRRTFLVAKKGTNGFTINPRTGVGIGIYIILLLIIIVTLIRTI